MEPKGHQEKSIRALEDVLSSICLHARAVILTKDRKSNPTQDNPNKICMVGSKARNLLSNHLGSHSNTDFKIWKKICDATTYQGNDANLGLKRVHVWEACHKMVDLQERPHLDNLGIEALKQATTRFIEQMVEAWGETHLLHGNAILLMVKYYVLYTIFL